MLVKYEKNKGKDNFLFQNLVIVINLHKFAIEKYIY